MKTIDTKILTVIPVYNHGNTIVAVAERAIQHSQHVLVVDDGSKDEVAPLLLQPGIICIRHDSNRGKGQAILTAVEYAAQHGFSHIITLDADGQHNPEQIPDFMSNIMLHPDSIILGVRDFNSTAVPGSSRFGRAFGNFWVRIQTSVKINDIQSGFRAYPVHVLQNLQYLFRTFAFEDEVIVRALWAGVSVREIPVSVYYPDKNKRISHFRKLTDNVKLTILNTWLTVRSFIPWPHPQIRFENNQFYTIYQPVTVIKMLLSDRQQPWMLALAGGLGVFLGALPLIACHTLAIIYAASMLRLNKIVAVAASQLCAPPLVPVICIELGYYLRFGRFLTFQDAASLTNASLKDLGIMGLGRLMEWFIGAMIVGPLLAVITGIIIFVFSAYVRRMLLKSKAETL
jgi:glycosyltransferase involved in cell wall biosynthesis